MARARKQEKPRRGGDRQPLHNAAPAGITVDDAPVSSLLLRTTRGHFMLATMLLREVELVPPQELVLMELGKRGECAQTEINRTLGRDRSTVTNILQAMERNGLIARRESETDARAVVVTLTQEGRALYPKVLAIWRELERRTIAGLSARDLATLTRVLTHLSANVTARSSIVSDLR